jgi:hypothetical protein
MARSEPIDGIGERPRRLGHECGIGIGCRPYHVDPPAPEVDDEEPHFGREEVGPGDVAPVSAQKGTPGRRPARRGRDPVCFSTLATVLLAT